MKFLFSQTTILLSLSSLICVGSLAAEPGQSLSSPNGQQWLKHVRDGLAPYWMMDSAYGNPPGNFPTFRCDNGQVLEETNVCPELDMGWITAYFGREYTRMKSRQTYAYGVLYHLTGDPAALKRARQGAYYLIEHLRDKDHGGFVSFTVNGQAGLEWQQRTAQDQAYALVGLAMYYYLTRDKVVEQALIEQQAFIFNQYRLNDGQGLAWVLKDGDDQSAKQRELVAQLDQINAYLLLVAPLLPEPAQAKWRGDLKWLTKVMLTHYHSTDEQRFYGAIHHKAVMMADANHNDFGHTIKAYWMTYLTAKQLDNSEWAELAEQGMRQTLNKASYLQDFNSVAHFFSPQLQTQWHDSKIPAWQSRPYHYGSSSWEWAELDQAAMTLSMLDGSYLETLHYTGQTFIDAWVDHKYGGVGLNPKSTKAFHWGNGYHQFEHALVGYIWAQQVNDRPVTLYYALPDQSDPILEPYYFQGSIESISQHNKGQKVTFVNIAP